MAAIITDTFDYNDIVRVLDLDEAFVFHQIDALQPKYLVTCITLVKCRCIKGGAKLTPKITIFGGNFGGNFLTC